MKNITFNIILIAAMLLTVGCADRDSRVTGLSLNYENITIFVGQSINLVATIAPENAAEKTLYWHSSNPDAATVDENGRVTGISGGRSTISVATKEGRFVARCEVRVDSPDIVAVVSPPGGIQHEGSITGNLSLRSGQSTSFPNHYSFQWFINTSDSNTGGEAIQGATSSSFQLPASLSAGTHSFYCRVNVSYTNTPFFVRSNTVSVYVLPNW